MKVLLQGVWRRGLRSLEKLNFNHQKSTTFSSHPNPFSEPSYTTQITKAMPPGMATMPPNDKDDCQHNLEIEMTSYDNNDSNTNPITPSTSNNPPLNQSRHNPDNQGVLKIISNLIMNPEADGSVIITPDKVQLLKSLIGVEEFINVKTLNMMDKITSRLDAIEKSISKPTPTPTIKTPPSTWSTIVKKSHPIPNTTTACAPPSAQVINEFKPSFFIIRKTVPEAQAFAQKSPAQIIKKVNSVLSDMEAKTKDGTPITIKGAITLPSGDVKFFTPTSHHPHCPDIVYSN
ncbi:hypothetical protein PGTUg99_012584 [Puccinia graminis f. sp. tritici]|uniref:Uncharacterized protein n=1 Tax=Puccinia graminis f. sp. tritici TaxID=56615 RepID=A0A5B0RLP7_PUCGR|nr:hypothetical protein PGTUg99_012584 [Puccinia graminis f. sp. tritici]